MDGFCVARSRLREQELQQHWISEIWAGHKRCNNEYENGEVTSQGRPKSPATVGPVTKSITEFITIQGKQDKYGYWSRPVQEDPACQKIPYTISIEDFNHWLALRKRMLHDTGLPTPRSYATDFPTPSRHSVDLEPVFGVDLTRPVPHNTDLPTPPSDQVPLSQGFKPWYHTLSRTNDALGPVESPQAHFCRPASATMVYSRLFDPILTEGPRAQCQTSASSGTSRHIIDDAPVSPKTVPCANPQVSMSNANLCSAQGRSFYFQPTKPTSKLRADCLPSTCDHSFCTHSTDEDLEASFEAVDIESLNEIATKHGHWSWVNSGSDREKEPWLVSPPQGQALQFDRSGAQIQQNSANGDPGMHYTPYPQPSQSYQPQTYQSPNPMWNVYQPAAPYSNLQWQVGGQMQQPSAYHGLPSLNENSSFDVMMPVEGSSSFLDDFNLFTPMGYPLVSGQEEDFILFPDNQSNHEL